VGPLGTADGDRRADARGCGDAHERRGGDQRRGVPGLCRAGAAAGPARLAGRHRGDGQSAGAQGRANLPAHRAARVRRAFEAAKIAYRYLPSYSPDFNPIEPCWSKLKGGLRAKAARTLQALEAELSPALATITAQDAQGWFRLCGYGTPN
jgi:hypothetical protein